MGEVVHERFAHTPFVCGYLGPDQGGHWADLMAAAPTPVKQRSSGRFHAFAASRAPGLERVPGRRAWVWGRHLVTQRQPTTWREAAHELNLSGFWVGDGEVRLHTDALAQLEIYARVLDGTTYFANRADPLSRLGSAPLQTDWDAWGEHLVLGGMAHDRTPFLEIRRLDFAESRVVRQGRSVRSRDLPAWMQVDRVDGTRDEVLEATLAQMPPAGSQEPSAIGLSGGWDSRFIGVLLDHLGVAAPSAWTSHKDMWMVDDHELAPAVAAALGMEHHDAAPSGPGYWRRYREQVLHRFEHEVVLHTWLAPLSNRVRKLGVPVWDGLHGDLLFRSVAVNQDLLWAGPRAAQREAQWIRLAGRRWQESTDAVRLDLRRRFHDVARATFMDDVAVFEGQATELVMRTVTTKGARITGASPGRLLAPEAKILLPFAAPTVFEAAVRVPALMKAGTSWYRDMIAVLNPTVAALPSTNDRPEHIRATRLPGQMRPAILRAQAARICADDVVLSLFHPRAQNELRAGRAMGASGVSLEAIQWAESLVSWRDRYRDRLVDDRL